MIINKSINILDIANSDFINGLSNIAQFYNIYQSTKAGTYAKLNNDIVSQTATIENDLDIQTQYILSKTLKELEKIFNQNEEIILQNKEIISLLKKGSDE